MHTIIDIIAKYFIVIPVVAAGLTFLRLEKRRRLGFVVYMVLGVVVTAVFIKIAGSLHQDPRPFVRDGVHPYFSHGADNGFPSDHTAFSAAIAFVVMRYYRWWGVILAVVAMVIGWARVVAGVHHGQDIIGGFLLAAAATVISLFVGRLVAARRRPRRSEPSAE